MRSFGIRHHSKQAMNSPGRVNAGARAERHGAALRWRQRRPFDTGTTVKPSWRAASARRLSNTTKGRDSLISPWR
jgi:hypothetical protein